MYFRKENFARSVTESVIGRQKKTFPGKRE